MKSEQIILALVFGALAVVVLLNLAPQVIPSAPAEPRNDPADTTGMSSTPVNSDVLAGPTYLTYNMPYFFVPPVSNFLPTQAAFGQGGAAINVASPIAPTCIICGS